jgi:hypothetical protein
VLEGVEERIGLVPGYAYEVLLDLARPWTMPLLMVDGQGNFGSRGNDPAANYRYTEAGLTRAGQVVLARTSPASSVRRASSTAALSPATLPRWRRAGPPS